MTLPKKNSPVSHVTGLGMLISGCIAYLMLTVAFPARTAGLPYGAKGTLDFIQYWSAFHVAWDGGNPYDGVLLHQYQVQVGQDAAQTVFMWNPPWLLLLLAPVLSLPFETAALVWLVGSGVALFLIASLLAHLERDGRPQLLAATAAATLFYPIWENVLWGQTGLMLALFTTIFYWAAMRRMDIIAGLALVPLSVKPHLFYLVVPLIGLWVIREKRLTIAYSAVCGLTLLILGTVLVFPGALGSWIELWSRPPHGPGVVTSAEWTTSSIASWVRVAMNDGTGIPPTWPMSAIPLLTLVMMTGYLIACRPVLTLERHFVPALAFSMVTSPYGWLYDQSVLVLGQSLLILGSLKKTIPQDSRRNTLVAVAFLQLLLILTGIPEGSKQHHFAWFPLAFGAVWLWRRPHPEK